MTQQERAEYYAAIRDMERQLGAAPHPHRERREDCVMLISIEKRFAGIKGGVTMQVGKRNAAKLIVEGTHRLATDEEIAAYWADQEKRKADAIAAENRSAGRGVFYVQAKPADSDSSLLSEARQETNELPGSEGSIPANGAFSLPHSR